ncbi:MAG TPA: hypothetical protein VK825_03800 [Xanthobacteraceae bacterium]|jgi:hypothetical protein|nr:hypothetical protein [Xanthobacteraceae bacterium]
MPPAAHLGRFASASSTNGDDPDRLRQRLLIFRALRQMAPAAGGFGEATLDRRFPACQSLTGAFSRFVPIFLGFFLHLHSLSQEPTTAT